MERQIIVLLAIMLTANSGKGQVAMPADAESYRVAFEELHPIPAEYELRSVTSVELDKKPAYLFRYVTAVNQNPLGEHLSFIMDVESKKVRGFMHAARKYAQTEMLSAAESQQIAMDFLRRVDPHLAGSLNKLWIAQHNETLVLATEKSLVISGMKYKCYRPETDDYSWVIVGFDGSILSFERDIRWDMQAQARLTEKWLYDNWLLENGFTNLF